MMMMIIVRENTTLPPSSRPQVLLSVLLIGKKYAVEYIAPALFRLNTTGELVIKATGSLSIVTAVYVAQLVKRDVGDLVTKSITIGTDELTVVGGSGISKRMSCIEIHLAKNITASAVAIAAPETVAETVAPVIEETTTTTASNVVVTTAKKSSTKGKRSRRQQQQQQLQQRKRRAEKKKEKKKSAD
jgi:DNA-binding protein Alba